MSKIQPSKQASSLQDAPLQVTPTSQERESASPKDSKGVRSLYDELGASASKEGLHRALSAAGLEEHSGFFCKLVEDIAGDPAYSAFVHCDGAGTKSIIAYLLVQATGRTEYYAGLAQDALVMNLDDIYCIGTPDHMVLSNIINRNKDKFGDDALSVVVRSYSELVAEYKKLGLPLVLGGGETADCGDIVTTVALDAIVAGRIRNDRLINTFNIEAGDSIVGLSSTGQASYEKKPNSGIGSNGLTLARHVLISKDSVKSFPEVGGLGEGWRGPFRVTDAFPALSGTGKPALSMSVGEALLSPTRTYAPVLAEVYKRLGSKVHGAIHCSGGGQTKVLRFGKGKRYVKDSLFETPPLFQLIQETGQVAWREMYQVFNMGHRLELYVPAACVAEIISVASEFQIEAKQVGYVEDSSDTTGPNSVLIQSAQGEFLYQL